MSQPTEPRPSRQPAAQRPTLSRRHALGGVAGVGLGLPLLAACAGEDSSATDPAGSPAASTGGSPSADSGGTGGTGGSAGSAAFASTSDVPVGSGAVFPDEGLVVTQPTEGEFLGFSITCTHQGCPVDSVTDAGINCPCHGSVFDLSSGAPTAGPASSPLGSVALTVDGNDISRA